MRKWFAEHDVYRIVTVIMVVVFLCLLFFSIRANGTTHKAKPKTLRGCTYVVTNDNLLGIVVLYEQAEVIGQTPDFESYWVNFPWRDHKKGMRAWKISKGEFLPMHKVVMYKMMKCQCPEFFWQ